MEGDLSPLEAAERLYELGDHVYMGPVNGERGILTIHKDKPLALAALQDIKVLQRRPSRPDDVLGADSLDLLLPHGVPGAEAVKKAAGDAEVTVEPQRNESHHWLSVVYRGHEFKLQDHTVWEVCAREAARAADYLLELLVVESLLELVGVEAEVLGVADQFGFGV